MMVTHYVVLVTEVVADGKKLEKQTTVTAAQIDRHRGNLKEKILTTFKRDLGKLLDKVAAESRPHRGQLGQ